MGGNSRSEA
ncbi:hypothetical protein LINGRAHAP2_LOCUS20378 [Linum grandiflorum]